MRIRQVKPAFWADARVAAMPPAARLFYIGLWMIADDAGWLRWDPAQVANELYGYEYRSRREKNVLGYLAYLQAAERVVLHPCSHLFIPTLIVHQRQAATTRLVKTVQKEHEHCGAPLQSAEVRGDPLPSGPVSKGSVTGYGQVGSVTGKVIAREDEPDTPEFLRVVQ